MSHDKRKIEGPLPTATDLTRNGVKYSQSVIPSYQQARPNSFYNFHLSTYIYLTFEEPSLLKFI